MNLKRILLSVATLALVGSVVGGTVAYYNDTETSEGNIFTAGSVDLKVDHLKQTYNGEDCTTHCDSWAKSVVSFDQGDRKDGSEVLAGRSDPSEALGPADTSGGHPDPSPSGFVSLGFGGSIVLHFPDGIDDGPGDDIRIWEATAGENTPAYPDESIRVEVSPNGVDWATVKVNPDEITFDDSVAFDVDIDGQASLVYYVRITDITDSEPHNGGADGYDLDAVEALHCGNEQTDGEPSEAWQCQLWEETDLTNQSFFIFNDIKPGDWGTNVISLHVNDNDAYSCLIAHDGDDQENGVMESEGDDDSENGELQNYINVFTWSDNDADGFYEPADGETALGTSTLGELGSLASLDGDNYLSATTTEYIGLEWCAGDISVNHDSGEINCDGHGMKNDAQSDSFSASLTAFAEQVRNNSDFSCEDVDLGEAVPDELE